jgi:hypothetical protein
MKKFRHASTNSNKYSRKLVNDDNWILIRQLQTQATTKVKLKGKSSKGFTTKQGIKQEAKLSPTLYKAYNNQLLENRMVVTLRLSLN